VDQPNLVLDTIKQAESGANEIIVRIWESFGGRGTATLTTVFSFDHVTETNLLEEELAGEISSVITWQHGKSLTFKFKPFQVLTFKLTKKSG
jgi:alpha-mannosidase